MTSPALDPLRLHVAHFAADAQEAEGDWAIAELPRLADSECPSDAGSPLKAAEADAPKLPPRSAGDLTRRVHWRAVGATRPVGGEQQIWLHLLADADVILQCQRCLLPLDEAVRGVFAGELHTGPAALAIMAAYAARSQGYDRLRPADAPEEQ